MDTNWTCYALLAFVACASLPGCVPSTDLSLHERLAAIEEVEQAHTDSPASNVAPGPDLNASEVASGGGSASRPVDRTGALVARIDRILTSQLNNRLMDSRVNAAWQIMHGVVCYGEKLPIATPDRGTVGALDYVFHGGVIQGFEIYLGDQVLPATGRSGIKARVEPGSYIGQGHPDQWLAICAMSNVPAETEIVLGGETRTLLDWSRQVQWDVQQNLLDEFSWTLIALTHYLPDEPVWTVEDGTQVDWESLVAVELDYDLHSSPCGGAHRLGGLVRAVAAKERLKLPDSAVWSEAKQTIQACIDNARQNRSSDGSLSSYYFVRPSKSVDLAAELASAGHIFEFLALAVEAEELQAPWLQLAATRICQSLESTQHIEMECGALYHALNGLRMYRDRCLQLQHEQL